MSRGRRATRRRTFARTAVVGGPPESTPSSVDQVKELAELREQGILTKEEFAAEKKLRAR